MDVWVLGLILEYQIGLVAHISSNVIVLGGAACRMHLRYIHKCMFPLYIVGRVVQIYKSGYVFIPSSVWQARIAVRIKFPISQGGRVRRLNPQEGTTFEVVSKCMGRATGKQLVIDRQVCLFLCSVSF